MMYSGGYSGSGCSSYGAGCLGSPVSYATHSPSYVSNPVQYSSIDTYVQSMMPGEVEQAKIYHTNSANNQSYSQNTDYYLIPTKPYEFVDMFLEPVRPLTQFINRAEQIKHHITETFEHMLGKPFPDNIAVRICDREEMINIHSPNNGEWSDGILGFAINNRPYTSEIFVLNNNLDRLMLVIGHEIGHVLSNRLKDNVIEEAKAFSFEFAWAKTIKEHNIAGLADSITLNFKPAKNGLHNIAFDFVRTKVTQGLQALEVYFKIIAGELKVSECIS